MTTKHNLGQYFTTNNELQEKVFEFILNSPSDILEPSIGQGDLINFIKDKIPTIVFDMFEIDTNIKLLDNIPKNMVVYDDFMTQQIIKTYTLSKGMVDSFRLNNDLVGKFEIANKIFQETTQEIHKQQAAAHYAALVNYAKSIKETHQTLKNDANQLLRTLRKHGVLSEK